MKILPEIILPHFVYFVISIFQMEWWYTAEKTYCVSVIIVVYKDESTDAFIFPYYFDYDFS